VDLESLLSEPADVEGKAMFDEMKFTREASKTNVNKKKCIKKKKLINRLKLRRKK